MAERVRDFKAWVNTLNDDDMVAIDDGGLTLVVYPLTATIEELMVETCS